MRFLKSWKIYLFIFIMNVPVIQHYRFNGLTLIIAVVSFMLCVYFAAKEDKER